MLALYFTLLVILATGSLAVLNGEPATPHQFPYHVGLYWLYSRTPISLKYYCGGTLISDKWVLTSAQCIPNLEPIYAKAGKHFVDEEEENDQDRIVVHRVYHPKWKKASLSERLIAQNDIAMLKVHTPFIFNKYVSAAKLPSTSSDFLSGSLAGWGSISIDSYVPIYPKELHFDGFLPVIEPTTCAGAINMVAFKSPLLPVTISNNQICSGPINGKWGACLKDDGSAFVSRRKGEYTVVGVVAHHLLSCGTFGLPTVYTRVSAYTKWINEVIESS